MRTSRPTHQRGTRAIAAGIAIAASLGVASSLAPTSAHAEPAAIREKKAEVRKVKAKLEEIGRRVEVAAERYNGAKWRLGEIKKRLVRNQAELEEAIANLHTSERILAERLDDLYRHPDPGLIEVIVNSGSLTDAVSTVDAIERAGSNDARVVGKTRALRNRTITVRRELTKDREAAKVEVRKAGAERVKVEAILQERRQLLENAKADLRQAIADEAARQREAALAAARGRQVAAASGYTPYNGPLPSGEGNAEAVRIMMTFQGVPYVWGGESPSGFDCSGLATYAYRQIGKDVPHYTYAIWSKFPQVPFDQLQVGDMVFFHGLGHMGIYIGNGMMIHAPHTGDVVRVAALSDRMGDYVGAVRP